LIRVDAEVTGRKECVRNKEKLLGILPIRVMEEGEEETAVPSEEKKKKKSKTHFPKMGQPTPLKHCHHS